MSWREALVQFLLIAIPILLLSLIDSPREPAGGTPSRQDAGREV